MKGLVVYQGKYGATQQYAQWVSEKLGIAAVPAQQAGVDEVKQADYLAIGTSVYIGKLQITKWLKKHIHDLKDKKIFLFLVAGTPPDQKEKLDVYINKGVPGELRPQCTVFYLPGRLHMAGLSWTDRLLLKMGARLIKDAVEKKAMLTDYDKVEKSNLNELFDSINSRFPASIQTAKPVLL